MTNPATDRIDELARVLGRCLQFCNTNPGHNLPELLAAALTNLAYERGGSWALTIHRPGSWEATHVEALAASADYQLRLENEQPDRAHRDQWHTDRRPK